MSNFLRSTIERPVTTAALGLFVTALTAEVARNTIDTRTSNNTGIMSFPNPEGPTIIMPGGRGQNNKELAPIYGRLLSHFGSVHVPYQTEGEHSDELLPDQIAEICADEAEIDRDRILVATSKGFMDTMNALQRSEIRTYLGRGALMGIVGLSPMTSRADLTPETHNLLDISRRVPNLAIVDDLHRAFRLRNVRKRDIPHSDMVSAQDRDRHYLSSARMPWGLLKSQDHAIDISTGWAADSMRDVVIDNPGLEIVQVTAPEDHIVDRRQAFTSMESAFGIHVREVVDDKRPNGHADDIEFPFHMIHEVARLSHISREMTAALEHFDEELRLAS